MGLSDIVHKCLRPDPRERYPDAAALAADLRRHLNHLPLLGVPNRSLAERWRKWRRRRPSALPRNVILLASTAAALATAALLSGAYRQRVHDIEAALGDGRAYLEAPAIRRGRPRPEARPGPRRRRPAFDTLRRALDEELGLVLRDWKAAELHRLADLVRFRYGLAPNPSEEALSLIRRGREIWEARSLLTRPIDGRREPEVERSIRDRPARRRHGLGRPPRPPGARGRGRRGPPGRPPPARRGEGPARAESRARPPPPVLCRGPRAGLLEREPRGGAPRLPGSIATWGGPTSGPGTSPAPMNSSGSPSNSGRRISGRTSTGGSAPTSSGGTKTRPTPSASASRWPPRRPNATSTAPCAREALGQADPAIRDYTRALQLDRTLTDAALNRGILHAAKRSPRGSDRRPGSGARLGLGTGNPGRDPLQPRR